MKTSRALLFCLLLFPGTARGKALKRMDTAELLEVIESHERIPKRIEAIGILATRGEESVIPQLGARCGADPAWTVCEAALEALRSFDSEQARGEILSVLLAEESPTAQRLQALTFLREDDPAIAAEGIEALIPLYASQDALLVQEVLVAAKAQALASQADFVLFICLDQEADRSVRLAALDAVEAFGHPRLHEAHMALLFDADPQVRIRCALALQAAGLPGSAVVPLLRRLLESDPEGYVREAAAKSLAFWAHPELLPLLHERVLSDRHPLAWESSFHLLVALADDSSVDTLATLIETNERLRAPQGDAVVRLLAWLGDASAISAIYDLEQRHQGSTLAQVCVKAVEALEGENYDREQALARLPRGELLPTRSWTTETEDPTYPPLGVRREAGSGRLLREAPPPETPVAPDPSPPEEDTGYED